MEEIVLNILEKPKPPYKHLNDAYSFVYDA